MPTPTRAEFTRRAARRPSASSSGRRPTPTLAFAEVLAPWTFLLPQTAGIRDDILRGSPLLLYAQVARRLDDFAAGAERRAPRPLRRRRRHRRARAQPRPRARPPARRRRRHGATRATRSSRCRETPADLDPAAGILTQGEGNVLSHVQLLARALGIPNVVLGPAAYERLKPHDGKQVFLIVTPGGRVILKEASAMTAEDRDRLRRVHAQRDARRATAASRRRAEAAHRPRQDRPDAKAADRPHRGPPRRLRPLLRAEGRLPRRAQAHLPRPRRARHRRAVRRLLRPLPARDGGRARHAAADARTSRRRASRCRPSSSAPTRQFFDEMIPAETSERSWRRGSTPRLDDHPPLDPPGAAARRSCARPSARARRGRPAHRRATRPSAASCAATPTSRTSTTSTAPASTSPSSTASRSTTSTRAARRSGRRRSSSARSRGGRR